MCCLRALYSDQRVLVIVNLNRDILSSKLSFLKLINVREISKLATCIYNYVEFLFSDFGDNAIILDSTFVSHNQT